MHYEDTIVAHLNTRATKLGRRATKDYAPEGDKSLWVQLWQRMEVVEGQWTGVQQNPDGTWSRKSQWYREHSAPAAEIALYLDALEAN
jgi:hypothetical protein